jgi:hypothetical protein
MVAPVVVVIVVPAWSHITATVVACSPPLKSLSLRVRHTIVPVKDSARLTVCRASKPPRFLEEGEVLHHLQVIAQCVDLASLDVDWLVVVWVAS